MHREARAPAPTELDEAALDEAWGVDAASGPRRGS